MPIQSYFGISSGRTDATTMSVTDAIDAVQNFPPFPDEQLPALHFQLQRKFVSTSGLFWPRGEPKTPSTTRAPSPPRATSSPPPAALSVSIGRGKMELDPFLDFHNKGLFVTRSTKFSAG